MIDAEGELAAIGRAMQDKDWSRPPLVMLEEVLRREVARARIYESVSTTAAPEDLIVEPILIGLIGAWEQMLETRSRTYATVAFHVKVFGPADASGKRALWMDERMTEHVASELTTGTPPPIPILTGRALSQLMNRLLEKLYQADGPIDPAKKAATATAPGKKNG